MGILCKAILQYICSTSMVRVLGIGVWGISLWVSLQTFGLWLYWQKFFEILTTGAEQMSDGTLLDGHFYFCTFNVSGIYGYVCIYIYIYIYIYIKDRKSYILYIKCNISLPALSNNNFTDIIFYFLCLKFQRSLKLWNNLLHYIKLIGNWTKMLKVHWLIFLWLSPSDIMFLVCASKSSPAFLDHSDHKSLLSGLSYHCAFHDGRGYKNVPITFIAWNPSFIHITTPNWISTG